MNFVWFKEQCANYIAPQNPLSNYGGINQRHLAFHVEGNTCYNEKEKCKQWSGDWKYD